MITVIFEGNLVENSGQPNKHPFFSPGALGTGKRLYGRLKRGGVQWVYQCVRFRPLPYQTERPMTNDFLHCSSVSEHNDANICSTKKWSPKRNTWLHIRKDDVQYDIMWWVFSLGTIRVILTFTRENFFQRKIERINRPARHVLL